MARKVDFAVGLWLGVAALIMVGAGVLYALERQPPLHPAAQLSLGLGLGVMALLIYVFSARKWLLVLLYRYGVFRPEERAQDAVELARADLTDFQTKEVDTGKVSAASDVRKRSEAILEKYNLGRALRPTLTTKDGVTKLDFERKQPFGKLEGYLLMHAALGFAAIAVALYHADMSLGGLVSGSLLVCWMGACLTGVYGGYLYWVMPSQLADAEVKLGFDDTRRQMERLDHEMAEVGEKKPDLKPILERQKAKLLAYYQPQAKRKMRLESWLWVHVPFATAALVLLIVHVISIWYY